MICLRSTLFAALAAGFALTSMSARAEVDKKTERLWKAKCASCHGADGAGATDQGAKMGIADYSKAAWQKAHPDAELKTAITAGVHTQKAGKKQEMDGYPDLSPAQVDALVAYIRTLAK